MKPTFGNLTEQKLKAIFWDYPEARRQELVSLYQLDPIELLKDRAVLIRLLNSLGWYDLIRLASPQQLISLLTDEVINTIYPPARKEFYLHAKRLLSKYSVPSAGQNT